MNQHVLRFGRQVAIAVIGGVVILVGIVLLLIPGPGIPLVLLGLGILSLEFESPRAWLAGVKEWGKRLKDRFEERRASHRDGRQARQADCRSAFVQISGHLRLLLGQQDPVGRESTAAHSA